MVMIKYMGELSLPENVHTTLCSGNVDQCFGRVMVKKTEGFSYMEQRITVSTSKNWENC